MADDPRDPRLIRGIDFKNAFPFTLIFRSFRVAVHPSKLILALTAMLLIYWGGRAMDGLTPRESRAVPDELGIYGESWTGANPAEHFQNLRARRWTEIDDAHKARLAEIGKPNGDLDDYKWWVEQRRGQEARDAEQRYETFLKTKPSDADRATAKVARDNEVAQAYLRAAHRWEEAQAYNGIGLF